MSYQYQPLRVRLFLSSPWALPYKKNPHPLHLDALLIAALTMKQGTYSKPFSTDSFDPSNDPYAPGVSSQVPLKAVERNGIRIYQASAAILSKSSGPSPELCNVSWVKKPPADYLYAPRQSEAWRKGLNGSYQCLSVLEIVFHCIGNREGIIKLLRIIRGIGAGRQAGLGQVAHFSVEEVQNADPATWGLLFKGLPARYLPVDFWPEGESLGWRKVAAAARPPYWHPALKTLCWAPGAAFSLPAAALMME
jgi:hypothetical protein